MDIWEYKKVDVILFDWHSMKCHYNWQYLGHMFENTSPVMHILIFEFCGTMVAVYLLSAWWAINLIKCSTVYGSYAHNMANNVTSPRFWPLKKPTMALIPCYFIERRSQAYRNNLIQFIVTGTLVSTRNYKHTPGVIRW